MAFTDRRGGKGILPFYLLLVLTKPCNSPCVCVCVFSPLPTETCRLKSEAWWEQSITHGLRSAHCWCLCCGVRGRLGEITDVISDTVDKNHREWKQSSDVWAWKISHLSQTRTSGSKVNSLSPHTHSWETSSHPQTTCTLSEVKYPNIYSISV